MKMETVDSGIGSRSPTPDSNSIHSQTNSSKVAKVVTHTNHINNNSHHNNTNSNGSYTISKTKGSEKGDASTAVSTSITTTASDNSSNGSAKSVVDGGSSDASANNTNGHNKQNNHTSSNSAKNSKTYRDYNNHNRHSSGHGQYKKYGSQNHYGYGGHMHCQRYNGNGHHRNYGNKHYHNSSNYHHNNHHYHGQSYQHHQYNQQNYHHSHHSNNNNNNNNGNNSNVSNSTSHSNSHNHQLQHHHNNSNHMNQYFNPPFGAPHPHHHHNHHHHQRNAPPQVFISSDAGDALSWTRRGGESSNNANWSSPSLDASDSSSSAVQINLTTVKQGCFSPSPQNASPALSPSTTSTTDSSDIYPIPDDTVTVSASTNTPTTGGGGTSTNNARQQQNNNDSIETYHYPSPRGARLMEAPLNGSLGPSPNGSNNMTAAPAVAGYSYAPFHQHPSAAFYAYHGVHTAHHFYGNGGRPLSHHHHQLISQNLELLMPADSLYPIENADSSMSSTNSDKTLEWSDDGTFFSSSSGGSDRGDDFQTSSVASSDRCLTSDFIFTPFALGPNGPCSTNSKKRFYNGNSPVPGKLSPANHNQRFHHYPRKMAYNPHGLPRDFFDDIDPDEYVRAFSKFGEVKERPKAMTHPQSDTLSEGIWVKFVANQQTTETFRKKMELWRDVYRIVRNLNISATFKHDVNPRNFPSYGLQVVGSTMSGFGSNTSDVDMCLLVRETEVDQRYEAVDKLQFVFAALSATHWLDNAEMIYAKVPILKFRDPKRTLEVDLNCNNFVGIRNTHLLHCYSQADWRLKPLVLVVKLWAHFHGINDAKNMTISSYSLVLMVIHFLQCGVEEPVLPVLQQMYPEKFSNSSNILHVKINEMLPSWQSKNTDTLGNLLTKFLEYYGRKFEYSENAVSVRTGGTIPIKLASQFKSVKNDPHQWKYLCIEEPFDRTNTARSVYDRETFDKIRGIFHLSFKRLEASRSLESIFSHISDQDALTMSVILP